MQNGKYILLVEDEPNFGAVMKNYLELSDFRVKLCIDGQKGWDAFQTENFDLCILDVMMPEMDGFTLGEKIRKTNRDVPLIFLTAKTLKSDIIRGYETGADDYITKPFDSELLIYKIKAILNRNASPTDSDQPNEHTIGEFTFNRHLRLLKRNNQEQKLSPKEAQLLHLLSKNINHILPREKALIEIWGNDTFYTTRSMDVYITKLRKYLKPDKNLKIENIHGSGFRLLLTRK
ncbi:MAG: response regulator transcription factor [Marinifilaceae bacterium]